MSVYNSGLTPTLKDRLLLIAGFMQSNGMAPTVQEMADMFETKRSPAQRSVDRLEQKGFLKKTDERQHRNISLTAKATKFLQAIKEGET